MKRLILLCFVCLSLPVQGAEPLTKADLAKFIKELASKDTKARLSACESIGAYASARGRGADASEAIDPLLDLLKKDAESTVRAGAAAALSRIKGAGARSLPVLLDRLKTEKDRVTVLAYLTSISRFRQESDDFPPALKDLAVKGMKEFTERTQAQLKAAEEELAKAKESGDKDKIQQAEDKRNSIREIEQNALVARSAMVNLDH